MTKTQMSTVPTTNTQIVKDGYEAFLNGKIEGLLALFADDVELITPTVTGAPFYGTKRGHESVRAFLRALAQSETFLDFQIEDFIAQNDRVVALGRSTSLVNGTGREFETDWVHVFTITDERVSRLVEFFDNAKAERAYRDPE